MTAQPLLLLGRGGFGREVAAWINARGMPFRVVGFLDDENEADDVVGKIRGHAPTTNHHYLTCFGTGRDRNDARLQLAGRGARFATLIAPDVMHASTLEMSTNSIFLGACSISSSVVLGADLLIQGFAVVGHDVQVGDGVTISSHAFVGGWARLDRFCTIHPHAVILPHVTVGEGAVVGAGAVVIKDVAPHTTVFGSPAKVIAYGKPHA